MCLILLWTRAKILSPQCRAVVASWLHCSLALFPQMATPRGKISPALHKISHCIPRRGQFCLFPWWGNLVQLSHSGAPTLPGWGLYLVLKGFYCFVEWVTSQGQPVDVCWNRELPAKRGESTFSQWLKPLWTCFCHLPLLSLLSNLTENLFSMGYQQGWTGLVFLLLLLADPEPTWSTDLEPPKYWCTSIN